MFLVAFVVDAVAVVFAVGNCGFLLLRILVSSAVIVVGAAAYDAVFAAFVCALTIKASLTAASNPTAFYFKPLPGQFQVLFRLLAVQLAKTNPDLKD